ncbi:primase-helicase zinc-binding domain-containing protein [Paraburkholderia sp. D1E]|uniref:primase-helicase zinc-binding domain-containing protein n=1 Tax=Paraburkholderia sp. D1E TaxID=3461398 RepID=UPI004045A5E0
MNVKDLKLTPAQWLSLLQRYGVPESSLSGQAAPCPMCGGTDRFTYDNKRGRGDWVCRQCDNGNPMAGDGFKLICRVTGMSFPELMTELEGGTLSEARVAARKLSVVAPVAKRKADPAFVEQRLTSMWGRAHVQSEGDLSRRYLQARVPGLSAPPSKALRLGMLDYRHEKKVIGTWPGILARFELPDGRLGTLHRTFLERSTPAKATIVTGDGEILDNKLNDMTLNALKGGAVRLMEPANGEIGVAEGLETAYAAFMEFGVPVWSCLNRVLLGQFVVPEGLGIRVVHIFVDFDHIDPKTRKSPGVASGVELATRLKKEGCAVFIHRPKLRGTDFCDEWLDRFVAGGDLQDVACRPVSALRQSVAA